MALKEQYGSEVEIIVADLDNPQTEKLLAYFPVYYIPAFYFINARGELVMEEVGVLSLEEMVSRVEMIRGETDGDLQVSRLDYFFSELLPAVVGQKSLLALVLVFFGGLVTSISPCILSMIPLLVGYIVGYGEGSRSRGFLLSLFFVCGLAVTFAILGFIAAYFGKIFGQISTAWYYILAAVAIIMGLQMLGVLTFKMPGFKDIPIRKAGLGGALLMGMLFGLVASPCATPVLAVIIAYAAVQAEPFYGSGLLFIYGFGHGLPLLAAGTFTGMARNLPKINRYTQYLSYLSGLILVLLGLILLIWVLRQ